MPSLARKGRGRGEQPRRPLRVQPHGGLGRWLGHAGGRVRRAPALPTELHPGEGEDRLSWNDSPDIGFDRSLNPYRGCEHGCIYCYARPAHAYVGMSPGLDFETRLMFKPNLPELLEKELSRPGYEPKPVALGANTDPYQPVERTLGITRRVLEVLERFGHPVTIVTKGSGVLRDLDILKRLAERNLVHVCLSITTLDMKLARAMEPRAASPLKRLAAVTELARAGIPAGVLAAPMIPGLNDMEMERILEASARAGATRAGYVILRLPLELKQIFEEWLHRHHPERAQRVLALVRETRAGRALRHALRHPPDRHRPLCRAAVAALQGRAAALRAGRARQHGPRARLHAVPRAGGGAATARAAVAGRVTPARPGGRRPPGQRRRGHHQPAQRARSPPPRSATAPPQRRRHRPGQRIPHAAERRAQRRAAQHLRPVAVRQQPQRRGRADQHRHHQDRAHRLEGGNRGGGDHQREPDLHRPRRQAERLA
jgi:DNA repair photolyase